MAVPIQAGDRGQIDGIVRGGSIAAGGDRFVAVEDHDLDQLEAAVPDEAPGLTEGSGYGSNKVTIVFDVEHLRTPFPDGREAREMPTTRAAGGANQKVTWKRSTKPGLPSEATASGDQSHCREDSDQRLSAEQAYVAHESLEQGSGMGHEQRPHDRRAPFVAEEVGLEVNGLAVRRACVCLVVGGVPDDGADAAGLNDRRLIDDERIIVCTPIVASSAS